jgi:hypothetical protein
MITDLKIQGTTLFVSVALLMGLGSQYVCTYLLHLLLCLYHNVEAKYGSLSRLGPTQGSTTETSTKCREWRHHETFLITIVVRKLC